ncbi:MAG: hypothetical protein ACLS48_01490 [[Eubacterium] siraeum]
MAKPQVTEAVRPHKRGSVVITDEARAKFRCFINEVSLSTFTDMINKHIDSDVSVKLKGSAIADWLTVIGMLTEETLPNGKLKECRPKTAFQRVYGLMNTSLRAVFRDTQ